MFHSQLGDLVDLARAFPETPIVLNHIGGALAVGPLDDKRQEVFAEGWLKPDGHAWGRPVDVIVAPDGSLLVSDDKAGAIYRIYAK